MFSKIGNLGGHSSWNWSSTTPEGDDALSVSVKWYANATGSTVFVILYDPATGEKIERRGTMRVERTLRATGERLSEPIFAVTISSIGGDVVGRAKTVRGAAEDYASKVLAVIARERHMARREALKNSVATEAKARIAARGQKLADGRPVPLDADGTPLTPGTAYRVRTRGGLIGTDRETSRTDLLVFEEIHPEDDGSRTFVFTDGLTRQGWHEDSIRSIDPVRVASADMPPACPGCGSTTLGGHWIECPYRPAPGEVTEAYGR